MLSIRDANVLAQRGHHLEAASAYAKLLFAYPDLAWSTIGGLRRCVDQLRKSKEWASSGHELGENWFDKSKSKTAPAEVETPQLQNVIDYACSQPAAKILYGGAPLTPWNLLLGLLHRQLWESQLIFPLPVQLAATLEQERYLAKKPIWSTASQGNPSSFLLKLAALGPARSTATTSGGAAVSDTTARGNIVKAAQLHHLSGRVSQEEIALLQDLIVLTTNDESQQRPLMALIELLNPHESRSPAHTTVPVPSVNEQKSSVAVLKTTWMEEAIKTGLFCETFYRRTNPDLSPDANLKQHYQEHGWREGRDPSQFFSTSRYLEIYPDVAASGMNPLEHYILHGIDRSRFQSLIFDQERSRHSDAVDLSLVEAPNNFDPNELKTAVLLHIHYPEVLHDILPILASSAVSHDLLITATSDAVASEIHAITAEYLLQSRTQVRVVSNRGRDISAFINEFTDKYQDYDLICKLHGKKSPHLDHFGRSWRHYLIANTIGNDDIVKRILYFFSISPRLGVFAPIPFKGTNNNDWADNLPIAQKLVAELEGEGTDRLENHPLQYPSATVFWFRPQSLVSLYLRYPSDSFPAEPLPVDGTVAHALERLIPFFANRSGYHFGCYRQRRSYLEWASEYPILTFLQAKQEGGRRKILLFSHDASNTGAPRTAIGLHTALNNSGEIDCLAVVLGGGPLEERFHQAGPTVILPNGICLDVLAEILETAPRDVSLICNTVVTAGVVEIARNFGLHTISLVHEYASAGFWPKDLFRKALEADVCVFPGTSVLETAVSYCGKIPSHTCLLRPQGLYRDDFPRFSRAEVRDLVLRELNLTPETIIVMGCGMLEHRKGFDLFLDTAQHLLEETSNTSSATANIAFIWVGTLPPSEIEETEVQLTRLKNCPVLSHSVHLLGQVAEADRYFAAADLFFLSSRFDPFPGVVLEAMAAAMPIVCFRKATDVIDAFIPPCGGYALDPIDAREAAAALLRLASNPSLRMEMGDFARRRLRSHYSFASYVSTLMPHLFPSTTPTGSLQKAVDRDHPSFSIVVPAFRTPLVFLQQLIHSVLHQTYPRFELIIAASELPPLVEEFINSAASRDKRIRPVFLEKNRGIAGNTNAALSRVTGTHICFLDHDDLLHAHCLQRLSDVIARDNPDLIYTDEDKVDRSGAHFHSPVRKPDYDQALLERNNYITHLTVVQRKILDRIGGVRSDYDGAQDYDFILRATDASKTIWHIPEVLYHWRESEQSTASGQSEAKPYAVEAGRRALEDHLIRLGRDGEIVENSDQPFVYWVRKKNPQ